MKKQLLLKTLLLAVLFLTGLASIQAQNYKQSEKTALRNFLQQTSFEANKTNYQQLGIDENTWTNGDAWINNIASLVIWNNETEKQVTKITFTSKKLAGNLNVSNFTALTNLNCDNNEIMQLTISGCTALVSLNCSLNDLTTLNANNLTALAELYCDDNKLATLTVSGCTALENLSCIKNKLVSLKANNLANLQEINCGDNKLTNLDVTNCTKLTNLNCAKNQLTALTINTCTALQDLNCSENYFTTFAPSNATLQVLNCSKNRLTSLNVNNCPVLNTLNCVSNKLMFSALPIINISSYTYAPQDTTNRGGMVVYSKGIDLSKEDTIVRNGNNATTYAWFDAKGVSISSKVIQAKDTIGFFYIDSSLVGQRIYCKMTNNAFSGLTVYYSAYITQSTTANHYAVNDKNALHNFLAQPSAVSGKLNLELINGMKISDTLSWRSSEAWLTYIPSTIIEWNTDSLKRILHLNFNSREFAGNLNLNNCTALEELFCNNNKLTSVSVKGDTSLVNVYCSNNELAALDVTGCEKIEKLYANNNQLTALDVSGALDLAILMCENNELTSLKVNQKNANTIDCKNNKLTTLDVGLNSKLQELNCSSNLLTSLTLNKYELQKLDCSNNLLTSLSIVDTTELFSVNCSKNLLTQLDFSTSKILNSLDCKNNQITTLKLFNNGSALINGLSCQNNNLKWSTLFPNCKNVNSSKLNCTPQNTINLGIADFVSNVATIDLSSENEIEGIISSYTWKNESGTTITPTAGNNGIFTFNNTFADKKLTCEVKNASFSSLTVKYEVKFKGTTPFYSNEDKTALRTFLNLASAVSGKKNFEQLGLNAADIATWTTDENWVTKVQGITWTSTIPMKIEEIEWKGRQLAGVLDLKNCEKVDVSNNRLREVKTEGCFTLKYLNCSYNQIETLNVKQNPLVELNCNENRISRLDATIGTLKKLYCYYNLIEELKLDTAIAVEIEVVDCSDNKLKFSTFPKLSRTIDHTYHLQAVIDGMTIKYDQTVDLSKEYITNKDNVLAKTEYKWYNVANNQEVIAGIVENPQGKFTFDKNLAGITFRCEMTNSNFPDLIQVYTVTLMPIIIEIAATGVTLDQHQLDFNTSIDRTPIQLTATVMPENATNKNVTWQSLEEDVATVDNNGLVTPVGKRESTYVIVTTVDGGYKDSCLVTANVGICLTEKDENVLVVLYPNPVKDILNIQTNEIIKSITIYDINGREVKHIAKLVKAISVADLKKGNYVIKIQTANGSTSKKFIKK